MLAESLNQLAEDRRLPAWTSWKNGTPKGYFKLPMTDDATQFFHENGFLVIEDAFNTQEIEALRQEALSIGKGDLGEVRGAPPITPDMTPEDILKQILCIHFPHQISEHIYSLLAHPAFVEVLTSIIGPNVKCMQSMMFIKASGKPGQAWHQDEVYIPTRDRSLCGGWIAMDDATVENGCLWVIPGSHKRGVMYFQEWHADSRFDCSHEARRFPWTNDDAVPVEVKAGSIVFFNGYLLHRSLPNYAPDGFRRSLVNHYMSAESLLPWYDGITPQSGNFATLDNRNVIMIAGEDPYDFKGYSDSTGVHIRPDGKGGCGNYEYNKKDFGTE
jgi:phytanoyl-CoA hydroxylase